MAINVVGSHDPVSLAHEAHISFRSTKANFHWSLSRCSMGSLEICTHVIPMPKSHNYPITINPKFGPGLSPHILIDKNVVISGQHSLEIYTDKNVAISGMHKVILTKI